MSAHYYAGRTMPERKNQPCDVLAWPRRGCASEGAAEGEMRRAARTDANQAEIVTTLRKATATQLLYNAAGRPDVGG